MMKMVVEGSSVTASQLKDFFRQIEDQSITGEILQALLERRNPFQAPQEIITETVKSMDQDINQVVAGWVAFWQKHGFAVDAGALVIPARRKGFDRLLIIPQGLTPQNACKICNSMFKWWKYSGEDLDTLVTHEDRTAKDGAYAIWIRERGEADQELKNLSANQLSKRNVSGITLTERLVYEAKYFSETGKHLDINSWTLCSGSRYSGGGVPGVGWSSDKRGMFVYWIYPDDRNGNLRSRQVVS